MTDYLFDYKSRRFGFGNVDEIRALRADKVDENRKIRRTEQFEKHRKLEILNPSPIKKKAEKHVESRHERLLKWKKERDMRNKLKKQQAKPVFKVGIAHHKYYSPIFLRTNITDKNLKKTKEIPKRVTRATEKRLAAKAAEAAIKLDMKTKKTQMKKHKTNTDIPKKSFAPEGYKFKPPSGLLQMQLNNTETPYKCRKSGTTNWFVFDEKDEIDDENKLEENTEQNIDSLKVNTPKDKFSGGKNKCVRFGRPSVQKLKFNDFNVFNFNTPATTKKETGSNLNELTNSNDTEVINSPRKMSSNNLLKTVKFNKSNLMNKVIEENSNEVENHTPTKCATPKINKTLKLNQIKNISNTPIKNESTENVSNSKTFKSPHIKRKIMIRRAKVRS